MNGPPDSRNGRPSQDDRLEEPLDTESVQPVVGSDAEAAVAGGVLWLDAGQALELLRHVQPDDLQTPTYARILRVAGGLAALGSPPEPGLVLERGRAGLSKYAEHQLAVTIASLYSSAPTPSSIRWYAQIVVEHAVRREAQACAVRLAQAAEGSLEDLADVWASVSAARGIAAKRLADR